MPSIRAVNPAPACGEGTLDEPDAYRVIVTDNGPGIEEHLRQGCLDPAFTTRLGQGSSGPGAAFGTLAGETQTPYGGDRSAVWPGRAWVWPASWACMAQGGLFNPCLTTVPLAQAAMTPHRLPPGSTWDTEQARAALPGLIQAPGRRLLDADSDQQAQAWPAC